MKMFVKEFDLDDFVSGVVLPVDAQNVHVSYASWDGRVRVFYTSVTQSMGAE
jgi:hypothetical protein